MRTELQRTLSIVRSSQGAARQTALHHLWFVLDSLREVVDLQRGSAGPEARVTAAGAK